MTDNKSQAQKSGRVLNETVRQASDLIAAVLRRIKEKHNSNKETA